MRTIAIILTLLFLFAFHPLGVAAASLEEQVLQIIRDHPEVILESVQNYEAQKRQAQRQQQQGVLKELANQPQVLTGASPTKGAQDQALLLEFSDFECPFCAMSAPAVRQFVEEHSEQVTLVYKHFPLTTIHDQAQAAAQASWAAQQQNKFWEYHDALFAQQEELGETLYIEIAQRLELKMEQFNRDRNSPAAAAAIQADVTLGEQIGIDRTPFFVLDGQVLDLPLNPAVMEQLLKTT
ncbi:hypothetical protein C1752_00488 [Acaryochloris thomasi RCC1774]|uniref:Thioredoxin domain-containing protein n=1 Tax=Acaryochloris thomasi RCC1774 TaxID=1764569 RepID=A0A2W1K671_9CYAN|nr:thioredoxin domain-containing protein [Acaryochloris thomasi]PZD75261.1 hypothetical protein C1752_00488 [Acaryochloris thomasi RCC1774]